MKKYIVLTSIFLALASIFGYFAFDSLRCYLLALFPPAGYMNSWLTVSDLLTLTIVNGSLLLIFFGLFIFFLVKLIIKIVKVRKLKNSKVEVVGSK